MDPQCAVNANLHVHLQTPLSKQDICSLCWQQVFQANPLENIGFLLPDPCHQSTLLHSERRNVAESIAILNAVANAQLWCRSNGKHLWNVLPRSYPYYCHVWFLGITFLQEAPLLLFVFLFIVLFRLLFLFFERERERERPHVARTTSLQHDVVPWVSLALARHGLLALCEGGS